MARRVVAALALGLALGVGARIVMRLIAHAAGLPGSFSWGGSIEVVLFALLISAPVALLFFAVRGRVRAEARWPGPATGAACFAVLAAWPPPSARSALEAADDPPALAAALFLGLFLLFGAGLEWLWARSREPRA